MVQEEEDAKKRALAEKYGVSSDEEEDDDVMPNPLPGNANGPGSKRNGNDLAPMSARSGTDGFVVDASDSHG